MQNGKKYNIGSTDTDTVCRKLCYFTVTNDDTFFYHVLNFFLNFLQRYSMHEFMNVVIFGLRKFRHGKSIALSTKLNVVVDGRAC